MGKPHKILLADDHSVVRQGISLVLKEAFVNISISQAGDIETVVQTLKNDHFDLLMLDINLPGGNTVNMINDIKMANTSVKILMFSAFDEEKYALRYIKAGANGYLNKLSTEEEIINAVKTMLDTGEYINEKLRAAAKENIYHNPLDILSNRELEIATLFIKGEGNLEIANLLDIQMSTVSTYKKRIFQKLGIANLPSLIEIYNIHNEA